MTKPVPTEHEEQKAVISWFNVQHKALKGRLIAVPNGAHLAGTQRQRFAKMARMKAEGLSPGFPDLFLPYPSKGFHGLAIEMKRVKGSATSKEQLDWLEWLPQQGYLAVLCKGADAAIDTIQAYLAEGE